jgi:hypothetical protein
MLSKVILVVQLYLYLSSEKSIQSRRLKLRYILIIEAFRLLNSSNDSLEKGHF